MLKSVAIGGVRKWECFAGTCVRPSSRDGNFSIPELALVLANILKGEFSFFYTIQMVLLSSWRDFFARVNY